MEEEIEIGRLYDRLLEEGYEIENDGKYELIRCPGLEVLTYGNRYVKVNALSRHRTSKHLVRISVELKAENGGGPTSTVCSRSVTVTTDHVCMVYNRDRFFENVDAKSIRPGDFVSVFAGKAGRWAEGGEYVGTVTGVEDLGTTEESVYDLEVDDGMHSFYANDVLIHNSIFLNLEPMTDWMKREYGLDEDIKKWPQSRKNELWKTMSGFVDKDVNDFVRSLARDFCRTTRQDILTYELEYMSSGGIYEQKKMYATHKIFDEGDPVDKIKYSGIQLKKGTLPKFVKKYLQEMYEGAILHGWKERDYVEYLTRLYNEFKTFSVDDISFWKGYSSERESSGFLQMAKAVNPATGKTIAATGISKACTYYNHIIGREGLNIAKKYEEIRIGDKVRMLYVDPNNRYRIDVLAYKDGQWPEEFNDVFRPDYKTMFEKTVLDSLKNYRKACGFHDVDPSKQVEFDVFDL